jgi:3-oxoacyl-[acyl-carrier protein] reductase
MEGNQPERIEEAGLQGLRAVVTGSSRGIGRTIAMHLAAAGADVLVHGNRSRESAQTLVTAIRELGRRGDLVLADVSDAAQRKALVDQAWQWSPRVDIWINNAGADVLTGEAAGWTFDQKLQRLWQVDVAATIDLSRQVGRRMYAAGRVAPPPMILNVGWDQAEQGMGGDSGQMFAAIKGAIMAFSRSLARSLAPRVRVNCLAPGWIKTAWGEEAPPYWQRRAVRESLLDRWGTEADVAQMACFLASPAASFINGQVLAVNGGFRHAEDQPDEP